MVKYNLEHICAICGDKRGYEFSGWNEDDALEFAWGSFLKHYRAVHPDDVPTNLTVDFSKW